MNRIELVTEMYSLQDRITDLRLEILDLKLKKNKTNRELLLILEKEKQLKQLQ